MSQTNFLYFTSSYVTPVSEGQAVFNESLLDPITDGSVFCRKWSTKSNSAASSLFVRVATTSVTDQFDGTYAVSLRCSVRPASASNGETITKVGLVAKGTGVSTAINSGSYYFKIENNTQFNLMGTILDNPLDTTLFNKWTKMRLDIVPNLVSGSLASDNLAAYVGIGTSGSEEWIKIKDLAIEAGSANFIAWDKATRYFGFGFYGDPAAACIQTAYYDNFEVYTEPVT